MTHAVTVPLDRGLSARVAALLRAIGWNGLFQVDFIEHGGRSLLIDLNPRVYTSLAITAGAGVNLLAIWVDLLRGRHPGTVPEYTVGVGYRHDEDDGRALLAMLRRGPRKAGLLGLLPRRRTTHPIFSIRDPLPFLTSLGNLARVGWKHARPELLFWRRIAPTWSPAERARPGRDGVQ
jgi:predicted ATP-grasp superfamily ATP-dependent carboligase